MGKINLSKPTFLILFLVVAGIGLTIGAASAVMVFTENLRVDNGAGSSKVEITSSTGNSMLTLTDQGTQKYAIILKDGKKKLLVKDVSKGETRLALISNGNFGIGLKNPTEKLAVAGNIIAENYFDKGNTQTGTDASALGGNSNTAGGDLSTVGGGSNNIASGTDSTVGGGFGNIASAIKSTIGGGQSNTASEFFSTVGGGVGNTASGEDSTVGGGFSNTASGPQSTVGGGEFNTASGFLSTVPGGELNEASGDFSFAAGRRAHAINNGAFVWGDSTNADITSSAVNQFTVRAAGGTKIFSNAGLTTGVTLASGTSAWAAVSDYRLKDNIAEYSVLDKLDDYRAVEFDWKAGGNHDVGVMAQELQSIFPELVNTGSSEGEITNAADPGVWSVQYSKLGALALQAIKEQQAIIDSLISIICEDNPDREICLEN